MLLNISFEVDISTAAVAANTNHSSSTTSSGTFYCPCHPALTQRILGFSCIATTIVEPGTFAVGTTAAPIHTYFHLDTGSSTISFHTEAFSNTPAEHSIAPISTLDCSVELSLPTE